MKKNGTNIVIVRTTRFWNNVQNRQIRKPNNINVFGSNKTKGLKQDRQKLK